jgi:hypothetical protein
MKTTLLVVLVIAATVSGANACSVSKNGDYLIPSMDPTLPVLMHHGKFIQCSSVFDPVSGQVLDCGTGAKQIRNPHAGGVLWGTRIFKHTDKCPVLPAQFQAN